MCIQSNQYTKIHLYVYKYRHLHTHAYKPYIYIHYIQTRTFTLTHSLTHTHFAVPSNVALLVIMATQHPLTDDSKFPGPLTPIYNDL